MAKLVTINLSGGSQITFMNYIYENGTFLFSTRGVSIKVRNLGKNPRIAVAIDDPQNPQRGVIAKGTATVTPDLTGELLTRVTTCYGRTITPEDANRRDKRKGESLFA